MNITVSIIIPCRNEERYIARCIRSIQQSMYPKELLRVFIVDGLSNDNTISVVHSEIYSTPYFELITNTQKTTPYALNLGIRASDSKVKIILGAHAEIYPDFIDKCVIYLINDNQVGCVGGILENVYEDSTSEIIGYAMSATFGVGNAFFRTGGRDGYVDTVAFGAYKKEVFDSIGLFNEILTRNQDDELNFRLTQSGYRILLKNDIRSKYYVRASYTKLFRQYFQYGYWKVFVNNLHKNITTARQIIPALFTVYLISFPVILLSDFYFIFWHSILALYICVAIAYACKNTLNVLKIIKTVYTFFILHTGYGTGYLFGILNILILKRIPDEAFSKNTR
jgi:glycosyltransferase involved in cell wall biosynthesis